MQSMQYEHEYLINEAAAGYRQNYLTIHFRIYRPAALVD